MWAQMWDPTQDETFEETQILKFDLAPLRKENRLSSEHRAAHKSRNTCGTTEIPWVVVL